MISEIDRWLAAELYRLFILSQEQIADCLNAQLEAEKAGRDAPLEDIVLKRGYITRKRLAEVLETVPPEVVEAQAAVLRRAAEARLAAAEGRAAESESTHPAGVPRAPGGAEPIAAGAVEAVRAGARTAPREAAGTPSAPRARLLPEESGPPIIEDFQLHEILVEGAGVTTYSASTTRAEERTLVRVLHPGAGAERPERRADFQREARLQDEFLHPNLLKGIGRGESKGFEYQITEHVDGAPLSRLLEHHVIFDLGRQVRIALQVGCALAYLHEKGLAHTFLHPDHIWLHSDGRVKVAGLGHAAAIDPGNAPAFVVEGFTRFTAREAALAEFRTYGLLLFHLATSDASVWKTAKAGKLVPYVVEGLRVANEQHRNAPLVLRSIIGRLVSEDPLQYFPHLAPIMKRLQLVHQPLKILVKEAVSFLVEYESKGRLRREVAEYFPEIFEKRPGDRDTSVAVREGSSGGPAPESAGEEASGEGAGEDAGTGAGGTAEAKPRPGRLGPRRLRSRLGGRMTSREKLRPAQRRREGADAEEDAAAPGPAAGAPAEKAAEGGQAAAGAGVSAEEIAGASTVNDEIDDLSREDAVDEETGDEGADAADAAGSGEGEEGDESAGAKDPAGDKTPSSDEDKSARRLVSRRLARIKGRRKFKR